MCGRIVNLDTVARVIADYYHLKTDTQLAALNDALSRVPAETVGKELFGNSEQLDDSISRRLAIEALAEWHDDAITNRLNNLPPAQPEIVRCKDCRFWSKYPGSSAAPQYHECMARMTHIGNLYTTAEEYCSRGKRKDGDHHEG